MRKNTSLSMIFLVIFVDLLGFGILIPILPTFATKELHSTEFMVGIAIATYSFVQFLFNPVLGGISDRKGRRNIILVTLLLNAAGYIIFAFSHNVFMLILSRVIAGIGGSTIGVAQAYIADVTTPGERSRGMGMIGVAFGLGFVIGPLLGGFLAKYGYEVTGFVCAGFSVTAFLLCFFLLPEPDIDRSHLQQKKRQLINIEGTKMLFKNKSIAISISLFFLLTFSVANIYGTFALIGHKVYGLSDAQNGVIFGVVGGVGVIVQGWLVGRLSKRFNDKQLITAGAVLMMIGLGFIPYSINYTGLIIDTIVMSIGSGMLQPVLLGLVSKVTPEKEQGIALGVNQSFGSIGRMLGPLWGGFAFEYLGYQIPFLTGAVFTFFMFVFSALYLERHLPVTTQTVNAQ